MALTDQQTQAAELLANHKTGDQVAAAIGVHPRTIDNWKTKPAFRQQVETLANAWRGVIRGKMDSDWRLKHLVGRHHRLHDIILDRAKDPGMQVVPGGRTGLMTVTYKMLNRVDEEGNRISEPCPEYAVDTGMLAEMRAVEAEIRKERGEDKPQRIDATLKIEDPVAVSLAHLLTREQLLAMEAKILELTGATEPK